MKFGIIQLRIGYIYTMLIQMCRVVHTQIVAVQFRFDPFIYKNIVNHQLFFGSFWKTLINFHLF